MKKFFCLLAILLLIASTFLLSCGNTYAFPNSTEFTIVSVDKQGLLNYINTNYPYDEYYSNVGTYEDTLLTILGRRSISSIMDTYYYIDFIRWIDNGSQWVDFVIGTKQVDMGDDIIYNYIPSNIPSCNVISINGIGQYYYGGTFRIPDIVSYFSLTNFTYSNDDVNNAYEQGKLEGLLQGYSDAYSEQYEQMTNAIDSTDNIGTGIIGGFMSGFNGFFSTLLNGVTIGGVVLLSFVSTLIFIVVAYKVIKMVK